jgi:hypothetical protein
MAINLLELIDGFPFPGTKAQLVEYAQENDASEEALDILRGIPEMYYESLPQFSRHAIEIDLLPGSETNDFSSVQEEPPQAPQSQGAIN